MCRGVPLELHSAVPAAHLTVGALVLQMCGLLHGALCGFWIQALFLSTLLTKPSLQPRIIFKRQGISMLSRLTFNTWVQYILLSQTSEFLGGCGYKPPCLALQCFFSLSV